ncbi:MAG: hypothetical protein AAFR98_13290 [Pseudomonadota bacterium]
MAALPAILDLPREWAAIGLLALVAAPIITIWISTRRLIVSDPVIVIGVAWFFAASLPSLAPGLYVDPIWLKISDQSLETATLWMYRSWCVCAIAYWGLRAMWRHRLLPVSERDLFVADRLRILIGLAGLLACCMFILRTGGQSYSHLEGFALTTGFDQVITELRQFSKIYVFLFFFAGGRRGVSQVERYLLLGILTAYIAIFAMTGSKAVVVELVAMWILGRAAGSLRTHATRDIAVGVGVLALIAFTFAFVGAYRFELAKVADVPAAGIGEALSTQVGAADRALDRVMGGQADGYDETRFDIRSTFDRLALVASFATMLDITGARSPYENTYQSFLAPAYAVLPRAFFGDKAQFFDSGNFAKLLGWTFGGFSVSFPGSVFWAWGFEGLLPTMAGLGFLLAWMAHRSEGDGPSNLVYRVAMVSLILGLLNVGSAFQPLIIGLVRTLCFVGLLYVLAGMTQPRTVH